MANQTAVERYLSEQAEVSEKPVLARQPDDELKAVVVVPALAESDTLPSFVESLTEAEKRCDWSVELVVVVNNSTEASEERVADNRQTLDYLQKLSLEFPVHALDYATGDRALEADRAGVGLARRIGLDVALSRLARSSPERSYLICCDADCRVNSQYLQGIIEEMERAPEARAGVCRYEHEIPDDRQKAEMMAEYELWLRYVSLGLAVAKSPYTYHDIGSTLVFTAEGYALADGFSRRKALADFETIQKIVKIDGRPCVKHLQTPKITTSSRESDRVARGTGAAMQEREGTDKHFPFQPARAFEYLREFAESVSAGFSDGIDQWTGRLEPSLVAFLEEYSGWEHLDKIRSNSSSRSQFEAGVFTYVDRLKQMRYANRIARQSEPVEPSRQMERLLEYAPLEVGRLDFHGPTVDLLKQVRHRYPLVIEWIEDQRKAVLNSHD